LAALCLQHLERERAALGEALAALRENRKALLQGNPSALAEAGQRQQAAADASARLRLLRDDFRREAAAQLNLAPEGVTLRALAAALPGPAGQQVAAARSELAALADEVSRLAASNTSLMHSCLGFIQRVVRDLTGAPSPSRYGRAGTFQEPSSHPLFQVRG
jgi:hypothetical protein